MADWKIPLDFAAHFAGLLESAYIAMHTSFDAFLNPTYRVQAGIENCCAALVDILVTFQLCYHFFKFRTGIKRTNKLVEQLIQALVTRGVLVTMGQICLTATFYAASQKLYWQVQFLQLVEQLK
ncbi:hypothetical protein D9758_005268 [Tetrapyrgos nigripes]|uniref:DUF6534 domain-containing protein n=1 Tax=Tetrapyrgos nigripes TaxID=182062 RepID=A0A8H5GX81_9AGAR|nr:hypothetical protein D9758_005268 [Tetrapyrgos nigripes]